MWFSQAAHTGTGSSHLFLENEMRSNNFSKNAFGKIQRYINIQNISFLNIKVCISWVGIMKKSTLVCLTDYL